MNNTQDCLLRFHVLARQNATRAASCLEISCVYSGRVIIVGRSHQFRMRVTSPFGPKPVDDRKKSLIVALVSTIYPKASSSNPSPQVIVVNKNAKAKRPGEASTVLIKHSSDSAQHTE